MQPSTPTSTPGLNIDVQRTLARDQATMVSGYAEDLTLVRDVHGPNHNGHGSTYYVFNAGDSLRRRSSRHIAAAGQYQQPSGEVASAPSTCSNSDASVPDSIPAPSQSHSATSAAPSNPSNNLEPPTPKSPVVRGLGLSETDIARIAKMEEVVQRIGHNYNSMSETLGRKGGIDDVVRLRRKIGLQLTKFDLVVNEPGYLIASIEETMSRTLTVQIRVDLIETISNRLRRLLETTKKCKQTTLDLKPKMFKTPRRPQGKGRRRSSLQEAEVLDQLRENISTAHILLLKLVRESGELRFPINPVLKRKSSSTTQRVEIPSEFLTTGQAARLIVDLLCHGCPIENHQRHQLLLGLTTETTQTRKNEVQFYMALEGKSASSAVSGDHNEAAIAEVDRRWFRVASKVANLPNPNLGSQLQLSESLATDIVCQTLQRSDDSTSPDTNLVPPSAFPPSPISPLVYSTPAPAVRFCLYNHSQYWTDSIAVSLTDPAHSLFYPRRDDHCSACRNSSMTPLATLLAEQQDDRSMSADIQEKIRWMCLLAEAVLKFNVVFDHMTTEVGSKGGDCDYLGLDEQSVFFYYNTTNGQRELHWRVDLVKRPAATTESEGQPSAPSCAEPPSLGQSSSIRVTAILRNLGLVFMRILRSSNWPTDEADALESLKLEFGSGLYNIVKNCLEMNIGQEVDDFRQEEVQRQFYEEIVCQLRNRVKGYGGLGASSNKRHPSEF